MQLTAFAALQKLENTGEILTELFQHGTLSIELYKPMDVDLQQSHMLDEVYVIIAGSGEFYSDGKTYTFQPKDLLFVPAGVNHRFINFTKDFSTWVIFYGPKGGEQNS